MKNCYPLPLIHKTLDALCRVKVYIKLDIIAVFNKLRIAEEHEWKTAFIICFGLFGTTVMLFGLSNALAIFQHYIDNLLYDLLNKSCTAYLDDVLFYSELKKEHRVHVLEVIKCLMDAGLQIDINKYEFEITCYKYLSLIITPDDNDMDKTKVKAITAWQPPKTVRDLQKFLRFSNFYQRFIHDFSKVVQPLNDLLQKGIPWHWEQEEQASFTTLKLAFIQALTLAHFDYDKRSVLETDTSD
jgi:hypothetical protein